MEEDREDRRSWAQRHLDEDPELRAELLRIALGFT